jgi:hypothetical protein
MSTPPIDDGGPAFPIQPFTQPNGEFDWGRDGMSLRDWFAGMALQGLLAANPQSSLLTAENVDRVMAEEAYKSADAMLAARKGAEQ